MPHQTDNLDDILMDMDKQIKLFIESADCNHGKAIELNTTHQHALSFLAPYHSRIERNALLITAIYNQGFKSEDIFKYIYHIKDPKIKIALFTTLDDYFEASKRFPAHNRLKNMLNVIKKYPLDQIPTDPSPNGGGSAAADISSTNKQTE